MNLIHILSNEQEEIMRLREQMLHGAMQLLMICNPDEDKLIL